MRNNGRLSFRRLFYRPEGDFSLRLYSARTIRRPENRRVICQGPISWPRNTIIRIWTAGAGNHTSLNIVRAASSYCLHGRFAVWRILVHRHARVGCFHFTNVYIWIRYEGACWRQWPILRCSSKRRDRFSTPNLAVKTKKFVSNIRAFYERLVERIARKRYRDKIVRDVNEKCARIFYRP